LKKEKKSPFYDSIYAVGGHEGVYLRAALEVPIYSDLWQAATQRLSTTTPVVDLGCGPGQFAEILRMTNTASYTGYDFSEVAVEQARNRKLPDCQFVCAELGDLALPECAQFVCLEVLEHIEADRELLTKIPTGARVVLSVPTYDSAGHVRVFPSPASVEERYADILSVQLVREIPVLGATKKIFLFEGVRR